VQLFPTSLVAQYFSAPTVLHRIPLGQPPSTTHVDVQRLGPFFQVGLHKSGETHSVSAAQRSSTSFVPPLDPPDPLEALEDALEDTLEDALELDALLLCAVAALLEETLDAPPIPPIPPVPPVSGRHWPA